MLGLCEGRKHGGVLETEPCGLAGLIAVDGVADFLELHLHAFCRIATEEQSVGSF